MSDFQVTTTELVSRMQKGWDDFQAYLKTLTLEQVTQPTDAAGWTVKDHIIHLATWEDGVYALLEKQPRHEQMGLDKALHHQLGAPHTEIRQHVEYQRFLASHAAFLCLRPHATQKGTSSLNTMFSKPARAIIASICDRVNRCSNRVPNRSSASVRMV